MSQINIISRLIEKRKQQIQSNSLGVDQQSKRQQVCYLQVDCTYFYKILAIFFHLPNYVIFQISGNIANMQQWQPSLRGRLKLKLFFVCDFNKNYQISSPQLIIIIAILRTLPLLAALQTISNVLSIPPYRIYPFIEGCIKIFLLWGTDSYSDGQHQYVYHIIAMVLTSIMGMLIFAFCSIKVERRNRLKNQTINQLKIIRLICLFVFSLSIPMGVFTINYFLIISQLGQWYLYLLPATLFLVLLVMVYIMEEFSNQDNYGKILILSKNHLPYQGLTEIIKLLIRIVVTVVLYHSLTFVSLVISIILLFMIDIYEADQMINKVHYMNSFSQIIMQTRLVLSLLSQTFAFVCLTSGFNILQLNLFATIAVTTVIGTVALITYITHKRHSLLLNGLVNIQQEAQASIAMFEYIKFFDSNNQSGKFFLFALIHDHRQKCRVSTCTCKQMVQNFKDPSQRVLYFHRFIMLCLCSICSKFQSSLKILGIYLNFKIHFTKSFSTIYYSLSRFKSQSGRELSLSDEFQIYQMQRQVQMNTDRLNQSTTHVDLNIVFREEILQTKLREAIQTINDRNFKKYSMIQQQFCKLNSIEQSCNQITAQIRGIQSLWIHFKQSNSYNMKVLEIFLVYNQNIIMSKIAASQVKTQMTTRIHSLRHIRGITNSNLHKYVHNKNACIFQSQYIEEKIGTITNVSSTCQQIFRQRKDKMIGSNIHSIMANFMSVPHQKVVREWVQAESLSGSLRNIINVFFVDVSSHCFEGSLYLKIKSIGSLLTFYGIIIKQNSDDFLILSRDKMIEGYGERLQNEGIMGQKLIKTKFSEICQANFYPQLKNKRSIKKKIIIKDALSTLRSSRGNFSSNFSSNLSEHQNGTILSLDKRERKVQQDFFYECTVTISKEMMGEYEYYTIKFIEINKILRRKTRLSWMHHMKTPTREIKDSFGSNSDYKKQDQQQEFEINNYASSLLQDPDKGLNEMLGENSSVTSSLIGGEIHVRLNKIYLIAKDKVINYDLVEDSNITFTTVVILVFTFLIIAAVILNLVLFDYGFSSFRNVLVATSSVSDDNVMLQTIFNHLLIANKYCQETDRIFDPQRCSQQLSDIFKIQGTFYKALYQSQINLNDNSASLSGMHQYDSLQQMVQLKLNDDSITISGKDFMHKIYYLTKSIVLQIQSQQHLFNFNITNKMKILLANWQTLTNISHNTITFYEQTGKKELWMLSIYFIVIFAVIFVLIIALLLVWRNFKMYMEQKKQNIIKVHGIVGSTVCEELKKAIIIGFQTVQILAQTIRMIKPSGKPTTIIKSQFRYDKQKSFLLFLLLLFTTLTVLNVTILVNMVQILPISKQLLTTFGQLMHSQKYVQEHFQQLKNIYLHSSSSQKQEAVLSLLKELNRTEPWFTTTAKQTLVVLDEDPTFKTDLNNLISNHICNITFHLLSEEQYSKCIHQQHSDIIGHGLITVLNAMQRQTFSALLHFQHQASLSNNSMSQIQDYLNSDIFQDLDQSLHFISNIYHMIQTRIISGFSSVIEMNKGNIVIYTILQIVVMLIGVGVWMGNIKNERRTISNLYGVILQFPQPLLMDNRWHIKMIQQNLAFDL